MPFQFSAGIIKAVCIFALVLASVTSVAEDAVQYELNIAPQNIEQALRKLAEVTGKELLFLFDQMESLESEKISGTYTIEDALAIILKNTSLSGELTQDGVILITSRQKKSAGSKVDVKKQAGVAAILAGVLAGSVNAQQAPNDSAGDGIQTEANGEDRGQFDVIVVVGTRNLAIRRTEDDIQPHVVFDSDEIILSGALDLEGFLRDRLPSNTSLGSRRQGGSDNVSSINLRGLGSDETLILVNGRRLPSITRAGSSGADFTQSDINGIPISSIERIEVLPSTASGIYGGGATGGVINIILRSDYSGVELGVNYDNSFDTDSGVLRLDGAVGFSLEGGRSDVFFTASYQRANDLLVQDRDFANRSRALAVRNNPDGFFNAFIPPAGYTGNIQGFAPLVLKDGTELGSNITFVPPGYAGANSDGGTALVANAGQFNLDLPNDTGFSGGLRTLASGPKVQNYSANMRREFSSSLTVYLDATYNINDNRSVRQPSFPTFVFLPATASTNPFTDSILVTVPGIGTQQERRVRSRALTISSGFILDIVGDWSIVGDVTWGKHDLFDTISGTDFLPNIFSAFSNGQIDPLSDLNAFTPDYSQFLADIERSGQDAETKLLNHSIRASGPLFELPAGDLVLSILAERRSQKFAGADQLEINRTTGQTFRFLNPPSSEAVNSLFAELNIPIFSGANARPGMQAFDVIMSVRYDDYDYDNVASGDDNLVFVDEQTGMFPDIERRDISFADTGITLGFKYTPVQDLIVRASFATGFLPPSLSQTRPRLIENQSFRVIDPQRGNVETIIGPIDRIVGGNPELNPEESESLSIGAIFTPRFLDGLRVSTDYVRIEKSGEIANLGVNDLLRFFPERFARGPLEPDAPANFTAGPIIQVNDSAVNVANTVVEAIDFQLNYDFEVDRVGEFGLYAVATKQLSFARQVTKEDAVEDTVGFFNGPIEWRANVGLDWRRGSWSAGWNMQFFDSYSVLSSDQAASLDPNSDEVITRQFAEQELLFQGRDRVPAQLFHDAYVRYVLQSTNTEIRLGINNIFNQSEIRADPAGSFSFFLPLDARLRTYAVTLKQRF